MHYIKEPSAIADNSTECELNSILEIILLDLAESSLWYLDNRHGRGDKAYQRAVNVIQTLNERLDVWNFKYKPWTRNELLYQRWCLEVYEFGSRLRNYIEFNR